MSSANAAALELHLESYPSPFKFPNMMKYKINTGNRRVGDCRKQEERRWS